MADGYGIVGNFIKNTPTSEKIYDVGDPNKYGSKYSSLVESNPYATMDYRPSFWQNILRGLGFRTNYDAYKESLQLQAKEYDAGIAQVARQEQYDSALEQVERERSAGINPDIAGNVDAGSSAGMPEDGNPPISPEADDFGIVSQGIQSLGAMCINSVQMAMGFAKDFQALRALRLDNDAKRLANSSGMMNFAFDSVMNLIESDFVQKAPGEVYNYAGSASDFGLGSGLSKKQRKQYFSEIGKFSEGLKSWSEEMNLRDSGSKSRQDFFQRYFGPTYSPIDSVMEILSKDYSQIVYDTWKSSQFRDRSVADYEKKQSEFDAKSLDAMDPSLVGDAENARNEFERFNLDLKKNLKQGFDKILKDLNSASQKGNWFAGIVSMIMSGFMMRYLNM